MWGLYLHIIFTLSTHYLHTIYTDQDVEGEGECSHDWCLTLTASGARTLLRAQQPGTALPRAIVLPCSRLCSGGREIGAGSIIMIGQHADTQDIKPYN